MTKKYIQSIYPEEIDKTSRLKVELFNTTIPSPLIVGSGTLIETADDIEPFLTAGAGAVVPRTTRKNMVRKVHPSPHLYQSGKLGEEILLNAEWTGVDIAYWRPHLKKISSGHRVIMSISGRDVEDCIEVCQELDKYSFPMLEINLSCAHSNSVHGFITRNGEHIKNVVSGLKEAGISTPIGIKMGHSDYIVELAQIAKDAGADTIVAVNTFGPLFDFTVEKGGVAKPILGIQSGKGGMSGSALFNIALTDIAEIRRQVKIPVIGCGGVRTAEHVIKMIMAGASAVQIYTAAHVRGLNAPAIFSEINQQLIRYMDEIDIKNIMDVKDKALPLLDQQTNLIPIIPQVDLDICRGCDKCKTVCLNSAIDTINVKKINKRIININKNKCIGCGHCVTVCPFGAIKQ